MSKNDDRVLGHADESDGIEEYDNPMPDWWVGLFFVTIVWGVAYLVHWHFIAQTSQAQLYAEEVAAAKLQWPDLGKAAAVDNSPETLALGAETYASTCSSCHGGELLGGIGPNLTDATWIHGGDVEAIVKTITEGVGAKGMPAWGPILGPKKIAALASFILSKQTGVPAPDAPPAGEAPAGDAAPTEAVADAGGPVDGAAVFTKNCVACHMADLTGGVGPNLVDDEWIHGGTLDDIRRTIIEGVPAKGMITWKGVLPDDQIEAVARYVYDESQAR